MKSPKALVIFHRLVNNHNRFSFNFKIYDMEVIRTFTTLTSLLDSVGVYNEIIESIYKRVITKVEETYSDLNTFINQEISHNQAINITHAC